ncbi:MAG: ATP-binding cassette domain-containing protein [Bacteroidetes bacterium]|nr:ATP-binding cassette domain-containing protein [Bacteroidota bacterium]
MTALLLTFEEVTVKLGGAALLDHLNWTIHRGQQWAIVGPSGSGKTVLAHTLLGTHFYTGHIGTPGFRRVAIVEQQHRFKHRPGSTELYYQQRFNASDADQTITVEQELAEYAGWDQASADSRWLDLLHIRPLLSKPLIQLSNGENKRVQLTIALLSQPELLILDNPFLGLDTEGRATLHTIINELTTRQIHILLITSPNELPSSITHIGQLDQGKWVFLGKKADFHPDRPKTGIQLDPALLKELKAGAAPGDDFTVAVKMSNTSIRYGEALILDNINWQVRKGERWNVSGPNGAGKSTILSLITADNPQAYANEIWLFDRRRGTGESIWDIKKKIGFVSPELHLYFDTGASCFEVIASGLFDTIGLFRPLNPEQEALVSQWIRLLSLQDLKTKRLAQLSTGQQRMVLLARALIKNPPMLILDEPCQGLDEEQTSSFRGLITSLCEAFDTTLIYVSHYRQELPSCIDRFLQLEKGKIVHLSE